MTSSYRDAKATIEAATRLRKLVITRCPFCCGDLRPVFARDSREFSRCPRCRAYIRCDDGARETRAYDSGAFAERIEAFEGQRPTFEAFSTFERYLVPGSLLEVGCGTGHLLAAAQERGFTVTGIEPNSYNREYIKKHWGIEVLAEPLESDLLPPQAFSNVLSINVFEHIADPYRHLVAAARVLRVGGRLAISTANADCLVASLCGRWWSMFKPEDHVSIGSREGLRIAGERAGLGVVKIWCSEYPLETPAGFAVALRDWLRSRRVGAVRPPATDTLLASGNSAAGKLMRMRLFAFVAALFSRLMVAGSIKVVYEKRRTTRH